MQRGSAARQRSGMATRFCLFCANANRRTEAIGLTTAGVPICEHHRRNSRLLIAVRLKPPAPVAAATTWSHA
jgi:hypothetical protein